MMSLFRAEALRSKLDKRSGTVLHYSPWTRAVGGAALALSVAVLGLVVFGHYTRSVAISGYLVPEGGILRVFAPQPGVVVEKRVKAGDHVAKGELLYVVSADREGRGRGPLYARATEALRERRAMTADSIEQTRSIQATELVRLAARREEVSSRLALLDDKIGILAQSIELRSTILDRKKSLSDRRLTPVDQSDQAALSLLDLRTQRASLQLDRSALIQETAALDNDLKLKPLQQRTELDNLERDLASLDQQLAESETRSENVIVAPANGTLSVDLATLGQAVAPNQPLAVIQPEGAALQVHLFAPSRAVGFVKADDHVNLRYQAFPYQKFGQYEGRVRSIARTALSAAELASLNLPQPEQNEPLYRIVVEPSRQVVAVNGGATPLQAGMAVDAFVLQEKRAIYEWMLEPLYTVKGVTHAGASDAS